MPNQDPLMMIGPEYEPGTQIPLNVTSFASRPEGRVPNAVATYHEEKRAARHRRRARSEASKSKSATTLAPAATVITPEYEPAPAKVDYRAQAVEQAKRKRDFINFLNASAHRMEKMAPCTEMGYDNGFLGFNRSVAAKTGDEMLARIYSGEVARLRPLDQAMGRNIKYAARHTASIGVQMPNYSALDAVRNAREDISHRALRTVANIGLGPHDPGGAPDWETRAANNSRLGSGALTPWGGSPPPFPDHRP